MVRKSSRERYIGVSMPIGLMKCVDEYLKNNPDLGYKSRAEFIKENKKWQKNGKIMITLLLIYQRL